MTDGDSRLWGWLRRRAAANRDIQIVLDRRQGERRRRNEPVDEDRRRQDRRRPVGSDLGEVTCFLGEGTRFTGDLYFRGAFRVDGRLAGAVVRGEVLIVGERGRVDAEIQVQVLQVSGTVQGNVTATHSAELLEPSHVSGTIRTPHLTVWKGAVFNGTCEMPSSHEGEAAAGHRPDNLRPNTTAPD